MRKLPRKTVLFPPAGECGALLSSGDKRAIITSLPSCDVQRNISKLLWPHFSNIFSSWNDDLEHIVHMFPPIDDQKQRHFISNFNKSHCSLNALQCEILSTFFFSFSFLQVFLCQSVSATSTPCPSWKAAAKTPARVRLPSRSRRSWRAHPQRVHPDCL